MGWHVRVLKAPLAILWGLFYPSLLGFSVSGKQAQPWCCTSLPGCSVMLQHLDAGMSIQVP